VQHGFEIRTLIAAAAAAKGAKGLIEFCESVPVFAVSCTVARMQVAT
jgi:2,3-dihydroxyphenylpropionate 1,2-dioxygenase